LLKALILVCSLAQTPDLAACDENNALYVMRFSPQVASPNACLLRGQAYLASTSLVRGLTDNERVKVICSGSGG
jgi:hypothetical protein